MATNPGSVNLSGSTVTYTSEPGVFLGTSAIEAYTSRSSKWNTREGDIRKLMYKMTTTESTISNVYKESLRGMIASFNDVS